MHRNAGNPEVYRSCLDNVQAKGCPQAMSEEEAAARAEDAAWPGGIARLSKSTLDTAGQQRPAYFSRTWCVAWDNQASAGSVAKAWRTIEYSQRPRNGIFNTLSVVREPHISINLKRIMLMSRRAVVHRFPAVK